MTALPLARAFKARNRGETILMLERGTWWTTPVGTVQDKEVKTYDFLRKQGQPVQFWPAVEHFKGFIDTLLRCARRKGNEDGLYDLTSFGRFGLLGFSLGGHNDGVTVLRASGVGGGSLVYANVTIRPPDFVLDEWPADWAGQRDHYFALARNAIGYGVLWALDDDAQRNGGPPADPKLKVNTGLSNVATRSARLDPHWKTGTKQIAPGNPADPQNDLWIDRARVFQVAMSGLTHDYGTVDSSINDITPEPDPYNPGGSPKNYCERQGRCILGCLPGARHTLNKQLMAAIFGTPKSPTPLFPDLHLTPLAEVEFVEERESGYVVHYVQRDAKRPWRTTRKMVAADKVIVAAGCVGTNEIMLRSKRRGGLPGLSDQVGFGFSTNGDYLAFLEGTDERVSLTRGPVTTCFAHFNTLTAGPGGTDVANFHTIEDNGIPRAFSSLLGFGMPVLRGLTKGHPSRLFILVTLLRWVIGRFLGQVRAFFTNARERQREFWSEDEYTANMMCIAAMGRDQAKGQFRLGRAPFETPLRVRPGDGREFFQDPIYDSIRASLKRFAEKLVKNNPPPFLSPFVNTTAQALDAQAIGLSHPLGGCRMAKDATEGVVDEYGRVFDTSPGGKKFYDDLYIADAAIIPTALGVNPSLTISALALRIADRIVREDLTP